MSSYLGKRKRVSLEAPQSITRSRAAQLEENINKEKELKKTNPNSTIQNRTYQKYPRERRRSNKSDDPLAQIGRSSDRMFNKLC
mmetsp:Transcript_35870/g.44506  ORF Transcript_35870/g.44506 Transcript_35870/m.44506 type:complete len:84 (-) Transcript_35870:1139-1390(-)